jgi:hypothetical protein
MFWRKKKKDRKIDKYNQEEQMTGFFVGVYEEQIKELVDIVTDWMNNNKMVETDWVLETRQIGIIKAVQYVSKEIRDSFDKAVEEIDILEAKMKIGS